MADCTYETYTIHTTSNAATSNSDYKVNLTMPLKDVVEARIVSASIPTATSNVVYLTVEELGTKFSDYSTVAENPFNGSILRNVFGTFFREDFPAPATSTRITFVNRYPIEHQYIYPIKRLDRLSMKLYDEFGNLLTDGNSPVYFTFVFKCLRNNLC